MPIELGRVEALYRYPVKSMQGERLAAAVLDWHGVDGDRRLAFRRVEERGGNPWLSAGRLADLTRFTPLWRDEHEALPTHVRTPDGAELPVFGDALAAEVARRHGAPVQMMQLAHGIFDEASVSVMDFATVRELARLSETEPDVRRFRPNVLVRSTRDAPFGEDEWVGGTLTFGAAGDAPAVAVTRRDLRCAMINIDPEGEGSSPRVMKACVRANDNHAGVYCEVTRTGRLAVGQPVFLHR
ncbi:MAG: MOSC N-terminal beta barrel domain-containing protein [Planctomycetota bacterium]